MSYLFGASTNPTVTSTDTTNNAWPSWYQKYINELLAKSSSVIDEPYTAYTGPRIAPTTADQQSAYNLTRQGIGAYQPQINAASGMLQSAGGGFNQGEFSQYMNPYVSNVVDRIGVLGGRNLSENLLPAVNKSFVQAGQFGSSRNQEFTARALRDQNESTLAEQNKALANAQESAMQNYQQGQQNKINAAGGLGTLASSGQAMGLKDAAALQAIGQEQQGQTQKSLDTAYADFLEQRGYPRQQAEWMSAQIRGMNPPTSSTSTSTGPASSGQLAPNGLAQLAGAAGGIGSLMGWFKKGGAVRRARGGSVRRSPGIGAMAMAA